YTQGLLAAVPDLERPAERPVGIPGTIPNLRAPPSGCRFHPRCPLAMPVCRERRPEFRKIAGGHRVACHAVAA
ncbi:MAG: oligopeptide/dipeptide ABC transporter ATP-binding protein, partial [Acetobacteraceae bacterium]